MIVENLVTFSVSPIEYMGVKIVFTAQLSELFGCSTQNITTNFRAHRAEFIEGVDYFYLDGQELKNFKAILSGKNYSYRPSNQVTNTYLWTESGVAKLSKIIGTDKAKLISTSLMFGYFQKAGEVKAEAQKNIFTADEKFEALVFLIDRCSDENLRNEMIKTAYKLLTE